MPEHVGPPNGPNQYKTIGGTVHVSESEGANWYFRVATEEEKIAGGYVHQETGPGPTQVVTVSSPIAISTSTQIVDTAGATTQDLPAANSVADGTTKTVKRRGAGNIVVGRDGSDKIDNAAADFDFDASGFNQGAAVSFRSNGVDDWTLV